MAFQLQDKRAAFEGICHRYRVARLELFGSATTDEFDPNASDLDLLVRFQPADVGGERLDAFQRYFGLKEDLESLFARKVDLVMEGAPKNPYFIKAMDESRQLLYAA
ncbi:MAG: nucleotidyltransferase domain-containing protein [Trueperaceae bacterium]|nr:MAG: nucleotidyltransferase domain-containing protein [Trueperaceae bacterium]